jgi:hypothetical protein
MMPPAEMILLYFVLFVWVAAGFADWICHRLTHIETTTGPKESLMHLLMLAEAAIPVTGGVFLQINAGLIALMIVAFFLHEATALWDVTYASTAREITSIEQHVHSFLEMMPLVAIVCVVILHWGQFLALFGQGSEAASFALTPKKEQLPSGYVTCLFAAIFLFEVLPYLEELVRCLRAKSGRFRPSATMK